LLLTGWPFLELGYSDLRAIAEPSWLESLRPELVKAMRAAAEFLGAAV